MKTKTSLPIALLEQRALRSGQESAQTMLTHLFDKAMLFAAQLVEEDCDRSIVVVPASQVHYIREALYAGWDDDILLNYVIQAKKRARALEDYCLELQGPGSYPGSQYVGTTIVARRKSDVTG